MSLRSAQYCLRRLGEFNYDTVRSPEIHERSLLWWANGLETSVVMASPLETEGILNLFRSLGPPN